MNKKEIWGGKEFIRVSRKRYENFRRFFIGKVEGNFFMDWMDSYDWSLRSGRYEIGTFENANECLVARHYVGYKEDDDKYYISSDYIKKNNYDLNTVVPKERKTKLTKEEKELNDVFCDAFNKLFAEEAKRAIVEVEDGPKDKTS